MLLHGDKKKYKKEKRRNNNMESEGLVLLENVARSLKKIADVQEERICQEEKRIQYLKEIKDSLQKIEVKIK